MLSLSLSMDNSELDHHGGGGGVPVAAAAAAVAAVAELAGVAAVVAVNGDCRGSCPQNAIILNVPLTISECSTLLY